MFPKQDGRGPVSTSVVIAHILVTLMFRASQGQDLVQFLPVSIGAKVTVIPETATCGSTGESKVTLRSGHIEYIEEEYTCDASCRTYEYPFNYLDIPELQSQVGGADCQVDQLLVPTARRRKRVTDVNTCFRDHTLNNINLYKRASYCITYTTTSFILGTVFTDGLIEVRASKNILNITCLGSDCAQAWVIDYPPEGQIRFIATHYYDETISLHNWFFYRTGRFIGELTSTRTPFLPDIPYSSISAWQARVGARLNTGAGQCEVLVGGLCPHYGVSRNIIFPNILGHYDQANVMRSNISSENPHPEWDEKCKYYHCAVLYPACDANQQAIYPCRSFCEEMRNTCVLDGYEAVFNCDRIPQGYDGDNCLTYKDPRAERFFDGTINDVRLFDWTLTHREAVYLLAHFGEDADLYFSQLNAASECLCPEDAPFIDQSTNGHLNVTCYNLADIYQSRIPHWPHPQYLTDGETTDVYPFLTHLPSEKSMWISEPGIEHIILEVDFGGIHQIEYVGIVAFTNPARNYTLIERLDGHGEWFPLLYIAWTCSQSFIVQSDAPCRSINSIIPGGDSGTQSHIEWSILDSSATYDHVIASAVRITLDGPPVGQEVNDMQRYIFTQTSGALFHAFTEIQVRGKIACDCYARGSVQGRCDNDGQCECLEGVDTRLAGLNCEPYMSDVYPHFGPVAGGTKITINGNLLPVHTDFYVRLSWPEIESYSHGYQPLTFDCNIGTRDSVSIVCTTSPGIEDIFGTDDDAQIVTSVQVITAGLPAIGVRGDFNFTYKANPIIKSIEPKQTILAGGIVQTVVGEYLDSVAQPLYNVYMVYQGSTIPLEPQLCEVINQTTMECPTPPVESSEIPEGLQDFFYQEVGQDKERPVSASMEDLSFYVGFTLDGVAGYTDLRESLPEYDSLEVYFDPDIYHFTEEDRVRQYNPTTPVNDVNLLILGARMTTGVSAGDYRVTIGEERCHIHYLTSNEITCLPPGEEPSGTVYTYHGAPRVLAAIGFKEVTVGYLQYPGGLWDNMTFRIGIILLCILILAIILIILIVRYCKRRREQGDPEKIRMDSLTLLDLLGKEMQLILQECLISWERLDIADRIGQGNFGQVCKGTLTHEDDRKETVAVKTLKKEGVRLSEIEEFLEEATIMRDLRHKNVLTLHGVCLNRRDVYVVLPFMEHGALREYLMKPTANFTVLELLGFATQVACGMAYLEVQKFVHRDLAARNCMVDSDKVVKIADFGLARDIYDKQYYRTKKQRPLPIRWMALECLGSEAVFSSKSDVWSFGVLVWEIITRGQTPYPDVGNFHIKTYLQQGHRLRQPDYCPEQVYRMMLHCWSTKPVDRPTFSELHSYLSELTGTSYFDDRDNDIQSPDAPIYLDSPSPNGNTTPPPSSGGHTTATANNARWQESRGEYTRLSRMYEDELSRNRTKTREEQAAERASYLSIVEPAYENYVPDDTRPSMFAYQNAAHST